MAVKTKSHWDQGCSKTNAGNRRLAGLGRGHAKSIGQALKDPVDHGADHLRTKIHGARTSTPATIRARAGSRGRRATGGAAHLFGRPNLHLWPILSNSSNTAKFQPGRISVRPARSSLVRSLSAGLVLAANNVSSASGGPTLTWYSPAESVCSKWNWLTPPGGLQLGRDRLFLGRDHRDRGRAAGRRK